MLNSIPLPPRLLGLAGFLPMAALLLLVLGGGDAWRWSALALGWLYAALIFSFLGGLWWALALRIILSIGLGLMAIAMGLAA